MKIDFLTYLPYLIVMVLVTYATRALPLIFVRKKFTNRFFISVCTYMPYAVLAVMTLPSIVFATDHVISGIIGFAVAAVMAYFVNSLIYVACAACGSVLISELVIMLINGGL